MRHWSQDMQVGTFDQIVPDIILAVGCGICWQPNEFLFQLTSAFIFMLFVCPPWPEESDTVRGHNQPMPLFAQRKFCGSYIDLPKVKYVAKGRTETITLGSFSPSAALL